VAGQGLRVAARCILWPPFEEIENEDDDEHEDDAQADQVWRKSGIVRIEAIDQSGQHCDDTRKHFLTGTDTFFPVAAQSPSPSTSSDAGNAPIPPAWKRADVDYFSPDRLEAYPTLRRRVAAVGPR
jgi:hypothetical protein